MAENRNQYREEIDAKRILQIREITKDLPQACSDFLRAIAISTGTFTRLAYAIDLNTFFTFLHDERIGFSEKDMKLINVVNGPQNASAVILGCMRMPALSVEKAADMIRTASEEGINFFDHATCYGDGEAETRFGDAFPLTGLKREDVIIQSKCGLHFDRKEFDWSRDDILSSAEASLRRLKTDYLDVLLLHRPDLLFDPEEVAEAFDQLEKSGKVRCFGVSNVSPGQLELLKKYIRQPLVFNQLQFSLDQTQLIDGDLYLNNLTTDRSISRDNGILNYCRLHCSEAASWIIRIFRN